MLAFRLARRSALVAVALGSTVACGSSPPAAPAAPTAPAVAPAKPASFDTSAVAEPAGLLVVGRMNRPAAMVQTAASWVHLPLPSGVDLVRSMTDDSVADVVDLGQPVDFALTLAISLRGSSPDVDTFAAFAVPVKNYEEAKAKLAAKHRLVPLENGQLKVVGLSGTKARDRGREREDDRNEELDKDDGEELDRCVLAPAPTGARLVCGEPDAVTALAPYLSRTLPRRTWASDVHVELRPEPIRDPLKAFQMTGLGKALLSMTGGGATGALAEASLGELTDFFDDAQKVTLDAKVADSGVVADARIEFQSSKSFVARAVTARGGEAPPPSFWHLPADTDTAMFGRGTDPKLFEHPRELLGNLVLELGGSAGMPDPERGMLKELSVDRLFKLATEGQGIYAKGFDQAALDKALKTLEGIKWENRGPHAEAKRAVLEQALGWHLMQVGEPVAQVGPMLKDWAALWNRPAFAKWIKSKGSKTDELPRFRIAPSPAGVTLPKETVHLEITVPRDEIIDYVAEEPARGKAPPKPKKTALKPYVFHVFAVPDGGKTWLAFGLDAKLVGQKAAASLASAPDANTLGKAAGVEALREGAVSSGGFFTLRGLLGIAAIDGGEHSPFRRLASLPHKGVTPIVFTSRPEPPSTGVSAGSAASTVRVSRDLIEDVVRLVISQR